ncbi:MAG: hypothetical protein HY906_08620 [Deltaproteobacteria bacterium]|nr:hypothetical protein [Deltaproteobacteria bacterium]
MKHKRFVPTHEEQLINRFLAASPTLPSSPRHDAHDLTLREVDCSQGRADVMRVLFRDPPASNRAGELGRVMGLPSGAALLAALQAAPRTASYLSERTGLSGRTTRQRLLQLEAAGLAERTGPWCYRRTPLVDQVAEVEIWSFEAKVDKWKRALYQAMQYRGFSHRSFVVLPADRARVALEKLDRFRGLGIGLVTVYNTEGLRVVLQPRRAAPFSRALFFLALGRAYEALSSDRRQRAKRTESIRPVA